ncbi:signal peptidase II [Profundibacterium mesophilum]|uniref:Lipoprotein signal peptidase n=1 Tax=Profundibacterium mesophilum KAUST100406-0324 TaxID=1037889 RepID=A0A921TDQ5_9RHOB|nr:signal peptidase II [Profundibacterium mesophilum]KAF0676576.1 Lipoprotein signal peptidase [Profundibacterium mesophilum KAUST100406-0324]
MWVLAKVAAAIILLDQITKIIVVEWLGLRHVGEIDVLPPYLNLRMAWNEGVNFGLFASGSDVVRWGLIGVALAISAWVVIWVWREGARHAALICAGLLVGGALGNVIDRLRYGAVADFLNVSCCGFDNPYAFNIADIAIFAGAIGLVLFTGRKDTAG